MLQGVLDRINLLVCHGYDPTEVASWQRGGGGGGGEEEEATDTLDEFEFDYTGGGESLYSGGFSGGGGGGIETPVTGGAAGLRDVYCM